METGDLITAEINRPKKRVYPIFVRDLKRMVFGYTMEHFKRWFEDNDDFDLEEEFDNLLDYNNDREGYDDEKMEEWAEENYRDQFLENILNQFETGNSFFASNECSLGHDFGVGCFIKLWNFASKWYKENFDTDIELKEQEQAWNTIAYWIYFEFLFDDFKDLFVKRYIQEYLKFKAIQTEEKRFSRIPCGVCYENKLLYTGCYTCNGNYICLGCYRKLIKDNHCPFCRSDRMVNKIRIHLLVEGFDKVLEELKSVKI